MKYVLDCSFSSSLFLPDENSADTRDFVLSLSRKDSVYIPILWWYETANVLRFSVKRNRLKHSDVSTIIELLSSMNFLTDIGYGKIHTKELFDLADKYDITSYDAAYLELAAREKARLMSYDDNLNKAARAFGVK
ncbi:MAG TPA: type II toxin-antitoxin system VapC family toxin [Ignavibacteria bacterium]|nr:type II toxin-antitoxin system VapC family toxin [Ignavibacteria bacterium]